MARQTQSPGKCWSRENNAPVRGGWNPVERYRTSAAAWRTRSQEASGRGGTGLIIEGEEKPPGRSPRGRAAPMP
jgi:hypothetical protein